MYHCLCLFQSYQLFLRGVGVVCIAGLWQCVILSLVLSQCASVVKPCVSIVVCVCQSGHPSRPLSLDEVLRSFWG